MTPEEIKALKDENSANKAALEKLTKDFEEWKKAKPEPDPEPKAEPKKTLGQRAKEEERAEEQKKKEIKSLEAAVSFNHGLGDFIKNHKDILPSSVDRILKLAEKEKFDSPIARANALRVELLAEVFAVQAFTDLFTTAQKSHLQEYLALTHEGKLEKSEYIYENLFEPALETRKKLKTAEEMAKSRSGMGTPSSSEKQAEDRLNKMAMKHYGLIKSA